MSAILQRITEAQNAHDADVFASYFAENYLSAQPAHPGRAFSGRPSSLPTGRPSSRVFLTFAPSYWPRVGMEPTSGAFEWRGHHTDGTAFAMRGVIIVTTRDDQIATGRLYMEPVEDRGDDIHAAVAELFRQPDDEA
jgi:hypothetical protein